MLGFSNMDITEPKTEPRVAFQEPYSDTLVMGAIDVKTGKTIEDPISAPPAKPVSRRWLWWLAAGVATYFVLR